MFASVMGQVFDDNTEYFSVIYNPTNVQLEVNACAGSTVCGGGTTPPVPEPGSIFLFASVLAGIGWRLRRRGVSL